MDNLGERIEIVLNSWAGIATRDTASIKMLHSVYQELYNEPVTQGCGNCNQKAFLRIRKYVELRKLNNPLTSLEMNEKLKNRKYVLKDGISLQAGFGGEHYTNDNLTDERAAQLIAESPGRAAFFSRVPSENEVKQAEQAAVKKGEKVEGERAEAFKQAEINSNTKVETDYPVKSNRVDSVVAKVETEKSLIDQTEPLPTNVAQDEIESEKGDKATRKAAKEAEKQTKNEGK